MPSAAPDEPQAPTARTGLALAAAATIGALVATQVSVNGALATAIGGGTRAGLLAALVSFGSGFVVLSLVAVSPPVRRGLRRVVAAVRGGRLRWWQLVGGAFGAFLVAAQGVAAPTMGVALFTVAMVAGQSGGGLVMDRWGVGPTGVRAVTATRAGGAAVTVLAVLLVVSGRLGGVQALGLGAALLALMPLLAGTGISFQAAVNGRVASHGGPLAAAWVNFGVGTVVLAVANGVAAIGSSPDALGRLPSPTWSQAWLYCGGVIGVVFIAATAALVRVLGVLLVGLATLGGQIVTATVIDLVNGVALGPATLAGIALTLAGVALAGRSPRGATGPPPPPTPLP